MSTLIRALPLAAAIGCAPPQDATLLLPASERIVGRASLQGRLTLLTNAPAIVTIDSSTRRISRLPVRAADRSSPSLWGLGELEGALYSLSGFNRLVRISPGRGEAGVKEVARLERPLANLIDTAKGMAAQFAVEDRGAPIAWALTPAGAMSPLAGPLRESMGLSRAEESLLYLLSCSPNRRAICWLPGSNQLLVFDADQLRILTRLEGVRNLLPAAMFASPAARSIRDVLWLGADRLAVLFEDGQSNVVAAEFDLSGRLVRRFATSTPLRLLVSAKPASILALAREGELVEVSR